ncbi:MAG: HAD-IC family P-type ATPase [bacterium]|nr:HAD-IC family P-type ATPase [bacterium]
MLGLVAFIDPAREETYDAVKSCQESGVKVYMITGDHPLTAYSIGKDLNIVKDKSQVTTGEQIDEMMKRGQAAFDLFIKSIRICARVTPLQKLAIVESLKRQGEFVAVTGDGINDTLAIKQANIGIAVGSGSDIAKEASDMIITDDKFSSIVSGINEGRMAYGNIRNVIYLLLSTGFCEIILYCFSIIFGLQFPLTAVQFLWLNLITNGIQSNAFAFEKPIDHISNKRIKKTNENIFNKLLISEILISGIFIGISVFVVYFILSKTTMNLASIRAIIVTLMVFFEDIQVINCRNEYLSLFKVPLKNNWILVSTIILSIVLQCVFVIVEPIRNFLGMGAINNYLLPILLTSSLSIIVVMELFKVVINKKLKQKMNNKV